MANIPIEKTGTPWWLWLLGLLLLGLLLWFLIDGLGDDGVDAITDDDVETVDSVVSDDLDLSDVWVTRVVNDSVFFVAPTEGGTDETLVLLEGDSPVDVTAGQHVAIAGDMEDVGDADLGAWGLAPDQSDSVGDDYVRASGLTVLGEGSGEALGLSELSGDLAAYAGRMADIDGARVTGLAGDSTFYLGDGDGRVLIVLESLGESEDGPGDGSDGVFDVNVGDVVSIDGEVTAFRRGMRGTTTLAESDRVEADRRRFVIVVNERGDFAKQ